MATPRGESLTLPSPQKKDHKYYHFPDNLWNHPYRTCPKIARFYHQLQSRFESNGNTGTHPSPEQLRDIETYEEMEKKATRIAHEKASDVSRLQRRRLEREFVSSTQLQNRSRQKRANLSVPHSVAQSLDGSVLNMTVIRPAPSPQVQRNEWQNINFLPLKQLKKILNLKELELEDKTVEAVLDKRAQWEYAQRMAMRRMRNLRDQSRRALVQRHLEVDEVPSTQLERKAGVIKLKETSDGPVWSSRSSSTGPFASTPRRVSAKAQALSQPKEQYQPSEVLLFPEFRGLIRREVPEAVRKLRVSVATNSPEREGRPQLWESLPSTPTLQSD